METTVKKICYFNELSYFNIAYQDLIPSVLLSPETHNHVRSFYHE